DGGHGHVLGEAAVHVNAQDPGVLAHVGFAGAAGHAVIADDVALARYALADLNLRDAGAALDHFAHELVPERHRRSDAPFRPPVPRVNVEVGAAYPGAQHSQQQLAGAARGHRHLADLDAGAG